MLARTLLLASGSLVAIGLPTSIHAQTVSTDTTASAADDAGAPGEIIVTAQKREESINRVGMSITAATGDQLVRLGVVDTTQLAKVIPGFRFNVTAYGSPVYTIRGVGYQESSLAAGPAVSVYVDEVPLPYSNQTIGATLDLARVEVLKGPQGTLFGGNSTGGAINYIAAKPTNQFAAGATASYGRFDMTDVSGYVSGPITSTLKARLSVRTLQSSDWQKSLTRNDTLGRRDQLFGRLLLEWEPVDRLHVSLNANAWRDRSDSQAPQIVLKASAIGVPALLDPAFVAAPLAPERARAADWDADKSFRNNNRFYQGAARIQYDLSDDVTLTSITSYEHYRRYQPLDVDGTAAEAFYVLNRGHINSFFQELRLSGRLGTAGHWLVGANYQDDNILDNVLSRLGQSSQRFIARSSVNRNTQKVKTKAVYTNVDYEILPAVKLNGGVRYTKADRSFVGCTLDSGDGTFAAAVGGTPGQCVTRRLDGTQGLLDLKLNQDNVSWRAGVDFEASPTTLLYANVSKGYKAGSFPNLTFILAQQATPVTQESLLAYEVGLKASLFDRTLQFNAAAFYYDYRDKQLRGATVIPPIGVLETLLNIPKSRVTGFEVSAVWRPVRGVTISPSVALTDSKITRNFVTFVGLGTPGDLKGESFPNTPRWSSNTNAEYRWSLNDKLGAYVGGTVSYQSRTNGAFGRIDPYKIDGYTLIDLRAGIEGPNGRWNAGLYGRNVTNKYYWTSAVRGSDAVVRYAGMPATYGVTVGFKY